ncbi:LysR substrate-binding domain-containing protein [Sphingomonas sp.]|uniref:LysR substrate-binding domain-containing protein n=1 Tax=Sphingomonas sp. TaxID=28214 RepID=UPI0035C82637
MEIRQLRYFVAVAEELNFSRAAERLNVSQPPLSVQIKGLESSLGTQLFNRDRRRVELTKAGEVLLAEARTVLAGVEWAQEQTRRAGRGEAGGLVIGFTSSVPLRQSFATLLRRFRDDYPEVAIETRMMSTSDQLDALAERRIDVGVLRPAYWYQPPQGVSLRPIWYDPIDVFLPADHRLAHETTAIDLSALREEQFIAFGADHGCGLYEHMLMLCGQSGFHPKVVQTVSVAASIAGLVAAGGGIALLPRCLAQAGVAGIVNRPLSNEGAISALQVAARSPVSDPVTARFLASLEDCWPVSQAGGP